MKKYAIIITFFLVSAVNLYAAKLTATTSRNPVAAGERFQVTFTLEGEGTDFQEPNFKGFSVLSGPNQSQSMQIINGMVTRSISISYILRADKEGKYTIKPASIKSGGRTLKSNSITITVLKGTQQQQAQRKRESDQAQEAIEIIRKNLFARLSVNKQNVYLGEQVIATYKLYKHPDLPLVDIELPKTPAFTGFWAQDIESINQLKWGSEILNGVRYQVARLKKVALLPQQSGKLTVDPIELECIVRLRVQQQSRYRDPFFGGGSKDFPYTAKSKASTLNVKPLPDGAPADFNGGVGEMNMKAWLDKTRTKTNEPITLKIRISGSGNLKLLGPLEINLPPDIDSYEPKTADNLSVSSSGFTGNKTFEYLLIPQHPGKFEIEPVSFSYFDLKKKEYVTLTSESFVIDVEKGDGTESTVISGVKKEEVKYLGKDIRFIKSPPAAFHKAGESFFGSPLFAAFNIAPLILFIVFIIYRKKRYELYENQALLKNRKANKIARKRLSTAKQFLKQAEQEKFYEETSRALWGYLSDKLGIPFSDLTKDTASEALAGKNIPGENIQKLLDTLADCEFARFAPSSNSGEMEKIYSDAASLITEMEGSLK